MPDLAHFRTQIDALDDQMTHLFEERMDVVRAIAQYKLENGLPVLQPEREHIVLERAEARVKNAAYAPAARTLYETVMALSRQMQHEMLLEDGLKHADQTPPAAASAHLLPRIAYPGAEGAFSEEAARRYFGRDAQATACPSFDAAAWAVRAGGADYAVLPIENSTAGSVDETYRLLEKYALAIVGEQLLPVRHHLLGVPGAALEDVREVRSHPQAIAQCHAFLTAQHAWRLTPSENTALSARQVAEHGDGSVAAIASLDAAERWGLTVLRRDIHDAPHNTTRFVIVAAVPEENPAADKASLTFTLDDRVGALARVIGAFARQGLNLSRLESRPMPETPWTYVFYADLAWRGDRRALLLALEEAGHDAKVMKLLGLYPTGREQGA